MARYLAPWITCHMIAVCISASAQEATSLRSVRAGAAYNVRLSDFHPSLEPELTNPVSVVGDLPLGLSFNQRLGVISGIVSRLAEVRNYEFNAAKGEQQFLLSLTVSPRLDPAGLNITLQNDIDEVPTVPCDGMNELISIFETRAPRRERQPDHNLALVDGLSLDRDVEIFFCNAALHQAYWASEELYEDLEVVVRVWVEDADTGWQELPQNELTREQIFEIENAGGGFDVTEAVSPIPYSTTHNPRVLVPLRMLSGLRTGERVRFLVQVRYNDPNALIVPGADFRQPIPRVQRTILDHTLTLGNFGLSATFSDALLLVGRLGEDDANQDSLEAKREGRVVDINPVLYDSINYQPAVSVSYGFTYVNRRNKTLQYMQPGFGVNVALMNWTDRLRANENSENVFLEGSRIQVGIGLMGSLFNNTVVATIGSNLNVKDHRTYVGLGLSVTGMIQKLSELFEN